MTLALAVSTLLLAVARLWTTVDPFDLANSGKWYWAVVGAVFTTVLFALAVLLDAAGHRTYASLAASFAFGSGISPCFATFPPHEEQDGSLARWWRRWLAAKADGVFKAVVVLAISAPMRWLFDLHIAFYVTLFLAVGFMQAKLRQALKQRRRALFVGRRLETTAVVGTFCLFAWAWSAEALVDEFAPLRFDNYKTALAFLLGLALRL